MACECVKEERKAKVGGSAFVVVTPCPECAQQAKDDTAVLQKQITQNELVANEIRQMAIERLAAKGIVITE